MNLLFTKVYVFSAVLGKHIPSSTYRYKLGPLPTRDNLQLYNQYFTVVDITNYFMVWVVPLQL